VRSRVTPYGETTCTVAYAGTAGSPHAITAAYAGDGNFNVSTSSALSQAANKAATSSVLTSSDNPAVSGHGELTGWRPCSRKLPARARHIRAMPAGRRREHYGRPDYSIAFRVRGDGSLLASSHAAVAATSGRPPTMTNRFGTGTRRSAWRSSA